MDRDIFEVATTMMAVEKCLHSQTAIAVQLSNGEHNGHESANNDRDLADASTAACCETCIKHTLTQLPHILCSAGTGAEERDLHPPTLEALWPKVLGGRAKEFGGKAPGQSGNIRQCKTVPER